MSREIPRADNHYPPLVISPEQSVSVSFETRAWALDQLSSVYADYAAARGLSSVVQNPLRHRERMRKLTEEHGSLENLKRNTSTKLADAQTEHARLSVYAEPLVKTEALTKIGFDRDEIEDDKDIMIMELRRVIGVEVGAAARNAFLDGLYVPSGKKSESNA